MKKILILILIIFIFSGCSIVNKSNVVNTSYGSFSIPNNWEKSRAHSTSTKYFYINKKDRRNSRPNNISVETGTNKYSKDDHVMFRQAILRELLYQAKISGYGENILGDGSTTNNGYLVYTFTMKDDISTTIQHYIVGDYRYVLVHETIWDGNEKDTNEAANYIVNTFKWNEK